MMMDWIANNTGYISLPFPFCQNLHPFKIIFAQQLLLISAHVKKPANNIVIVSKRYHVLNFNYF